MTKQEARNIVKKCRAALSESEAVLNSGRICSRLIASDAYRDARQVFCYAALPGEVRTEPLMHRVLSDSKILALPRVSGKKMMFYRIHALTDLCTGFWGIAEPTMACRPVTPDEETLLIMPGVAFDRERRRVGYGGGYYDRYLEEHRDLFLRKVSPAYDFQIFDILEENIFDRRPDEIITPGGSL